ncbi:TetR family transcriptional regulator [Nocardia sp. NPDC088792]|uniref:TetR/AcrR family transcriptional regulator n=1 Tax=Nocardia sp. NPDC088792 TaxID=3364332 RepID=UPI00381A21DB
MNSSETPTLRAATRALARQRILEAAVELAGDTGWNAVRMVDIATRAGVSRRTVFNEFGSKTGVLEAMSWHNTERYLTGSLAVFEQHRDDPVAAITAISEFVLRTIAVDPLAAAVLAADPQQPDEMLSMVTTQSGPFVTAATRLALAHAEQHWPDRFRPGLDLEFFIESLVRLLFSHIVQPGGEPEQTARSLGQLVRLALTDPP